MIKYDDEFKNKLKQLCISFDKLKGEYPEDAYEGFAIFSFLVNGPNDRYSLYSYDDEISREWRRELGIDD